jgi:hypothetical protein
VDNVIELQAGLLLLEQTQTRAAIHAVSLASQAETVQKKTGCDFLLLNEKLSKSL